MSQHEHLNDHRQVMVPKTYQGKLKEKPLAREMFRLKDEGASVFYLEHHLSAWCPLVQVMDIASNEVVSCRAKVISQGLLEVYFDRPVTLSEQEVNGHQPPYGYSVTLIG